MKKTFKSNNISCGSCANLIKASLEEEFGEVIVDLSKEPKEVRLEIQNELDEIKFKEEMSSLGFEIIEE